VLLLLDTHVWIWTLEGDRRIGRRTRQLLDRAAARDAVRVAAASVFEAAALYTSGRLRLASPLELWLSGALAGAGVRVAEIAGTVALDAGTIGREALPDPMDRVIVATARGLDGTLVTADRVILDYAKRTKNVRVQDGSR